ncbi:MAG: YciI family protein [Deltaproteobacteria bacterium]|nr:YciI family protein [Deltaproteobacteria bacterium]MBK8240531.1 YciI family protein [Deltaproteobacteria bacterium]MBK8718190.1 YciI family protein [Deltaproteobacteria bacterium]MBP7288976.1 YciI family protein [Nannocystaceae bacterium]
MQFLLLIYESEAETETRGPAAFQEMLAEYRSFSAALKDSGKLVGGDALDGIATATTVRVRDGKTLITDGPFAETREQLGGYYLVDATDLDDAMAIAAKIPSARYGSIEVRPIMRWS